MEAFIRIDEMKSQCIGSSKWRIYTVIPEDQVISSYRFFSQNSLVTSH